MITTDNKHAVGVFTNRKAVEQSVNELKASSFPMEKVAIFAKFVDRINPIGEVSVSLRINNQSVDTTGAFGDALTNSTLLKSGCFYTLEREPKGFLRKS